MCIDILGFHMMNYKYRGFHLFESIPGQGKCVLIQFKSIILYKINLKLNRLVNFLFLELDVCLSLYIFKIKTLNQKKNKIVN